jgi:cell division protein FtsX
MGQLKGQYPDLVRELEDLGQEMIQIVPRFISISGILPEASLEKIRNTPGIESAESSKDRYHHIIGAFTTLRWVSRILMGGICLALLTGLIHLSRMNAYLHRDTLTLLRFWGAGSTILAAPGMISGIFVGLLGGGIASVGWMTLGVWLTKHVRSLSVLLKGMPPFSTHLSLSLLGFGALLGLVAGLFGSLSASNLKSEGGFGG